MHLSYLLINICSVAFPLIFTFHPKLKFNKEWRAYWPANLITSAIFVLWDMYYTQLGVWGFNEKYITGYKIGNLPIEEVLFFVCIPYASVFTYHCLKIYSSKISEQLNTTPVSVLIVLILLIVGIVNITKLYTSVTFIALSVLILFLQFYIRAKWLSSFYLFYLVILLPFFIVNGILTGTGIDEPIVWYNNNENMGIRMLTIPIEDTFYGMILLLLNVCLFEYFKQKAND